MPAALVSTGMQFPDNSVQTAAIPSGAVIMWNGLITQIPVGWGLCDGTNGTPDLRDKFIVGAGSSYSVGATGGLSEVSLSSPQIPSHDHPAPASIADSVSHSHPRATGDGGSHKHPANGAWSGGPSPIGGPGGGRLGNLVPRTLYNGTHSHAFYMGDAGDHNHPISITVNNTGAGDSHENKPPFFSIAFIMRL